jgi:hypothetical protein
MIQYKNREAHWTSVTQLSVFIETLEVKGGMLLKLKSEAGSRLILLNAG